jgi:hypothetical protein
MEMFPMDAVPELNTTNLGNFLNFLTITHTTLSAKRFGCYDVLKFDFAAEFCFWTEQRLNGAQLLGLRLTEMLEVPNTITVGNSLSFLTVHNTAPISWRFTSYDCQKLDWFAETKSGQTTFWHKSGFWWKFAITCPEILNTKLAISELNFPLVTHAVDSDA